jgi:tetratricopeptide (TPR) repeat protein
VVSRRHLLGLALLALAAASGCAGVRPPAEPVAAPRSPAPPAASPGLNASVPTPDQLAAPHRAQAVQLEEQGRLRHAADAWITALALAPSHEPSRRALKRLRERIDKEIAEHVRRGWHSLAADDTAEARRHFLAALALDPDSRPTQDALRAVPAPAPTTVPAPEPRATPLVARPAITPPEPGVRRRETAEAEKPEVLYAAGRAHLAAKRDDDAYRALAQLARHHPGYKDSATLLTELRPRLVQQRYQEGVRLFREEMIEAAIAQWRSVLEIEPGHDSARRNIEQAERMLRTLAAPSKR